MPQFTAGGLSNEQYDALSPRLHTVPLKIKQALFERNQLPQYVYFPCTCVLSILAYMLDGSVVEVSTVGNEGFIGIEIVAGGALSTETAVCQVESDVLRMTVNDFKEAIDGDTPLRRITQRYMLVYISPNRSHAIVFI